MEPLPIEASCNEVNALLSSDGVTLVDCREADEHALVAIAGSSLMPMSELPARVAELEPLRGERFIVYCHHGMRSAQTVAWLRQQGFDQAQSLAGGIDQWAVEIDPSLPRY